MLLSIHDYFLQNIDTYGYFGLFVVCFLAATIIPFSSDFLFVAMLLLNKFDPWICTFVATIGNWGGGMTNYWLGKLGKIEWIEKYLKIKEEKIIKMQNWIEKRGGAIMAFFSFAPFVGDVMAVALGYMRANFYMVTTFMFLGKFSRYVVELLAVRYGVHLFGF